MSAGEWSTEEREGIEAALAERLAGRLGPAEHVSAWGASSSTQVEARLVLEGGEKGDRVELEARVSLTREKLGMEEARDLALDALDLILLEYLDSDRTVRFTGTFQPRELRGRSLLVRAERTFPSLEAQADALLRGHDPES
jgi:hypothetical protein